MVSGEVVALEEEEEKDQDQDQEQDNKPDDNADPSEIVDDESEEAGEGEEGGGGSNAATTETFGISSPETTLQQPTAVTMTSSGRHVKPPSWMSDYEVGMTAAEIHYYKTMRELDEDLGIEMGLFGSGLDWEEACLIGAGLGEGISNTNELKIWTFDEAMKLTDKEEWIKLVDQEHEPMKENSVFQIVPRKEVPHNADIIDSTWSMKKRANGVYRARLAGRGFKQQPGVSYDPNNILAPVAHKTTIKVALVLLVMLRWIATVVDVKGAFLKALFNPKHKFIWRCQRDSKSFTPRIVYYSYSKHFTG